jgi:hypothetical protein
MDKINWNTVVQSTLGALLVAALLGLFSMHTSLVSLRATIDERQKNAVKIERIGVLEAKVQNNAEELEQLRTWLRTLSDRVNTR